ncbi:MAG: GMP synthase [Gammaproteobacteria bacterium]|jgi:GMP synthase (glutamine-hydrolysing)
MKNYLVLQHTYAEFLGLIEAQLQHRNIAYGYVRPFIGDPLPSSASQYDGVFLLGGAWPTADRDKVPHADEEINVIRMFQKANRPVIGIGMGALLMAEAAGGKPLLEPAYTAKFTTAHLTEAGRDDEFAASLDGRRLLVLYHGDVELPEGVEPLLVDDEGHWLLIRTAGQSYGMLFRPEMKPGMLEDILMEEGHNPPPNIGDLLGEAHMEWGNMQESTDIALVGLVKACELMQERHKMPVFNLKVEMDESADH